MLVFTVIGTSIILLGSIWMQSKEQELFETLKAGKERVRTEHLSIGEEGGQEGSTFTEKDAEEIKKILPEYAELAKMNPDFAGWISIEGTNIDYPVMQSLEDREYYLHRDFYGKKSYAGVPFVGSGHLEPDSKTVFLYGHNMRAGTMFSDLLKYRDQVYWEEHPIIRLDTLYEHREYEVFAAFYAKGKEWSDPDGFIRIMTMNSDKDFNQWMPLIEAGLYDTQKVPNKESQILLLVTCSYQMEDGRFVVAAMRNRE